MLKRIKVIEQDIRLALADNANGFRSVNNAEIEQLKRNGNSCDGGRWKEVLRIKESSDLESVQGCWFSGQVYFAGVDPNVSCPNGLPVGLFNSNFRNCWICSNVRVSNCELVENTWIGHRAVLSQCGIITKDLYELAFGNGMVIPVVIGSGGRDVTSYADLSLEEACRVAVFRNDKVYQNEYISKVATFVDAISLPWNIIEAHAVVRSVSFMKDVYIGHFARIEGSRIENSTILSSIDDPTIVQGGSDVQRSILKKGVKVETQSIVLNSVMFPCSHAERHGKLLDSILGPYSGVAEGEISESLVGPFVGFHHQALLIASYWPGGRGNVGYGGNVGSNHTGKAPDQELWHGEGLFYGLGCCVKFPSDFTEAPYTLIATGVTTLPQQVCFPFSLIAEPSSFSEGVSPAFNEIQPGWVLAQNIYSILRSEHKFKSRSAKSKLVTIDARVFRPSTVAMMRKARDRLSDVNVKEKAIYTDRDFPGLGKNVMTSKSRVEAVYTYTYFMFYYAVYQGVWAQIESGERTLPEVAADIEHASADYDEVEPERNFIETGLGEPTLQEKEKEWRFQCTIIGNEVHKILPLKEQGINLVTSLLEWLKKAKYEVAVSAQNSKLKDEKRGAKMIPGYLEAHGPVASTDKIVLRAFEDSKKLNEMIDKIIPNKTSKL